jgi:hypothetical protein
MTTSSKTNKDSLINMNITTTGKEMKIKDMDIQEWLINLGYPQSMIDVLNKSFESSLLSYKKELEKEVGEIGTDYHYEELEGCDVYDGYEAGYANAKNDILKLLQSK